MRGIITRIFVFMSFACLLIATPVKEAGAQGSNWVWHGGDAYAMLDLPGNDYRNFTVRTGGDEVCKKTCAEDSRCRAFTFLGEKDWSSQKGQCYLKTKYDKSVYNKRCASTYKEYPTDFSSANNERIPDKCPEFSFATKSPIPSAVIGGPLVFTCCFGCQQDKQSVSTNSGERPGLSPDGTKIYYGNVEADIQAIKDTVADWEAAVNAGDIDKIMSF